MKKTTPHFWATVTIFFIPWASSATPQQTAIQSKPSPMGRVAVVDVDRLDEYHQMQSALDKGISNLRHRLNEQANQLLLSARELELVSRAAEKNGEQDRAKILRDLARKADHNWSAFRKKAADDIDKLIKARNQEIVHQTYEVVRDYATRNKIELVFSYRRSIPPIYAAPGVDITDEIIALLKKKN